MLNGILSHSKRTMELLLSIFFAQVFLTSLIFCTPVEIVDGEGTTLELVHVIFRHGQRTTYKFYPNDPYINETFYPVGLGGLTNKGKMQEFILGKFLRNLYNNFLGEIYTEEKIYVRSTDVTRTKMSAQLVLAGLFPPSKMQIWNNDLMWQPISVNFKPASEEDLIHPSVCAYKTHVLKNLLKNPEIQEKFIKPNKKLFDYIETYSGMKINDIHDILDFYFILTTEEGVNLTLPEWTQNIYPEPVYSVASTIYDYHNFNLNIKKINSGYLLQKIINDTQSKIDEKQMPKIFLYSGHETTIGYMLQTLNLLKPHVPSYSSALIFEIHKKNEDHFIKIRYRSDTYSKHPEDFDIPGCGILCPLNQFIELYDNILPTISIKDACLLHHETIATDKNII